MVSALIQLLAEKNMSEITISDLANKAGVSRMTYYRNYNTKEDIFIQYLDDVFALYHEERSQTDRQTAFYERENMLHCFHYFSLYRKFLNTLFSSNLGNLFLNKLTDYVLFVWYQDSCSQEYYFTLQAFVGSLYNLYRAWATNASGFSEEELADLIYRIYSKC